MQCLHNPTAARNWSAQFWPTTGGVCYTSTSSCPRAASASPKHGKSHGSAARPMGLSREANHSIYSWEGKEFFRSQADFALKQGAFWPFNVVLQVRGCLGLLWSPKSHPPKAGGMSSSVLSGMWPRVGRWFSSVLHYRSACIDFWVH